MALSDQTWLKGLRSTTPGSLGINREDYKNLPDGMGFSSERVLADQIVTDLPGTAADLHTGTSRRDSPRCVDEIPETPS